MCASGRSALRQLRREMAGPGGARGESYMYLSRGQREGGGERSPEMPAPTFTPTLNSNAHKLSGGGQGNMMGVLDVGVALWPVNKVRGAGLKVRLLELANLAFKDERRLILVE